MQYNILKFVIINKIQDNSFSLLRWHKKRKWIMYMKIHKKNQIALVFHL